MTTIVVVRHGETTWNRDRRMQGWAPTTLTDEGRDQADALGRYLAAEYDVDRVHCSDLLRTKETATRIREHVDAPVSFESAWRERDVGVYQGLRYEDMFERFPEFGLGESAVQAAELVPEGGESLVQVYERVTERFEAVLSAAGPDETRLVVSHGGPIYMLLGHVKELDVAAAVLDHAQDNCAVNEFVRDPETGAVSVGCENLTAWRRPADD